MKIFLPRNINKTIATILSVDECAENIEGIKNGSFNVISIRSSNGRISSQWKPEKYKIIDDAKLDNLCVGIFDDLQKELDRNTTLLTFPKEEHIFPILQWAKDKWNENHKPFIVHCTAGISRSSAIAILINKMVKDNVVDAFDTDLHWPNKEILRLGEKFLGVNDVIPQVEEKLRRDFRVGGVSL